ncbi:ty3-gypsy retrotransposon protein [Tanacetum coccineum]
MRRRNWRDNKPRLFSFSWTHCVPSYKQLEVFFRIDREVAVLLPQSMRLDVLKFSGDDPDRWIFAITKYFSFLNILADQRLGIVGFNLEGAVAKWFWWMSRNGLITTWDRFVESVKNRVGPSKYEDTQGALSKLLQLGTVEDYQREFEKLMNRVTDIPDSLLISFYISGLKLHLQRELLVLKPTTWATRPMTPIEEVVGNIHSFTLFSLVEHGILRSLQLWERIDIGDVHGLMDNKGNHNFVQPNAGERMRVQAMVTGRPYQGVEGSLEEATWNGCRTPNQHILRITLRVR